jgi:hypothetical protein
VFFLKFFSEKFLTDEHIKVLRESRKIYAKDKIVRHGDNFVEVVNFEKRMKVFPQKDELLHMIDSIERFDAEWNMVQHMSWDEYRNYRWEDLPSKLRSYIRNFDSYYFSVWFNKLTSKQYDRYDRAERRLLEVKGAVTDDDFEKYVLLGKPIPNTLGKKAKDSARRSYKTVNNYIKSNIHRFTTFLTFTFAMEDNKGKYDRLNAERLEGEKDLQFEYVNGLDFELAKKKFTSTMDRFKKQLRRKGLEFYYLAVWELQKNGNYHFHVLCSDLPSDEVYNVPKWLDYNFVTKQFNNGLGLLQWRYGKSDVQMIHSPEKITTYVSKYIIKSFLNVDEQSYEQYLNKKKFFPSQNLDKPVIDYFDSDKEFDSLLSSLSLEGLEGFEKQYKNPYNDGLITNRIYTKIKNVSSMHEDTSIQ